MEHNRELCLEVNKILRKESKSGIVIEMGDMKTKELVIPHASMWLLKPLLKTATPYWQDIARAHDPS